MSLLTSESNPRVGLTFSLPPDFNMPEDGDQETAIEVHVVNNPSLPIEVGSWRYSSIANGQWTFWFSHTHAEVGVNFRVRIQLFHNQKPLLLNQDHTVIVNSTPHRETVHLSSIGNLHVKVQKPRDIPAKEAVTVRLRDDDQPDIELVCISQDEQSAASFYLKYDPTTVQPGKRYSLSGTENRYNQALDISPDLVQLLPQ